MFKERTRTSAYHLSLELLALCGHLQFHVGLRVLIGDGQLHVLLSGMIIPLKRVVEENSCQGAYHLISSGRSAACVLREDAPRVSTMNVQHGDL